MSDDNPFFDLDLGLEIGQPAAPANTPETCTYCGEALSDSGATVDWFLTGVFGYLYCSKECRDAHVFSK